MSGNQVQGVEGFKSLLPTPTNRPMITQAEMIKSSLTGAVSPCNTCHISRKPLLTPEEKRLSDFPIQKILEALQMGCGPI